MILIISQPMEYTTGEVCRWLRHRDVPFIRLHPEDLQEGVVSYELGSEPGENLPHVNITPVGGDAWCTDSIRTVWYRRWSSPRQLMEVWKGVGEPELDKVKKHLNLEFSTLSQTVLRHMRHADWLNHPNENSLNKIDVLEKARQAGFSVPESILTGSRDALANFIGKYGAVISKPIREVDFFPYDGEEYSLYTTRFTEKELSDLPPKFFPSLFQRQIPKQYEIRTFYLDGACHSMAIFSQSDAQTELDFRRYNHGNMNQMVPFDLPREQQEAANRLMKELDMVSGSLDIIRDTDGRYIFLEVNPVGQFGMVSKPCNYHLEEKVAGHLQRKAAEMLNR